MEKKNNKISLSEQYNTALNDFNSLKSIEENLMIIPYDSFLSVQNMMNKLEIDVDNIKELAEKLQFTHSKNEKRNSLLIKLLFIFLGLAPAASSFSLIAGLIGYVTFLTLALLTNRNIQELKKSFDMIKIGDDVVNLQSNICALQRKMELVNSIRSKDCESTEKVSDDDKIIFIMQSANSSETDLFTLAKDWIDKALKFEGIICPLSPEVSNVVIEILQNDLKTDETNLTTLLKLAKLEMSKKSTDMHAEPETLSLKREKPHCRYRINSRSFKNNP